ncbi:zinc transport system ATP-binding protein [Alteribacillus persepolensis]|uniref:Zinc transport system ATP-binding protein n=1 Tax=Alteribacillus persepolensis TaxID=568899 RepID=A0A1G8CV52_9BACI|nr:metal ABC transporter ATP-binding protein [Alteribacillus persepolensis]SDH48820.1 zinc transport system ATP-binding protein [Alteribacillus persepolensis]
MYKSNQDDTVVQIDDVSFRYGSQMVLENISLSIKKGSFLGLVGPNGSGKSTLVKILLGLLKPTHGRVQVFDAPVAKFKSWEKIGYVSQKANSFNAGFPVTVFEVVSMGLYGKVGLLKFLSRKHKKQIFESLERVGMSEYSSRNIGELSGGQQQRVFIARALVSNPDLLILDEPTVGVDTASVQQFYSLLSQLNREKNITLLLVTHDVGVMTKYVSDVACLNKTLHFHGTSQDFENSDLSSLYGHDVQVITHDHGGAR